MKELLCYIFIFNCQYFCLFYVCLSVTFFNCPLLCSYCHLVLDDFWERFGCFLDFEDRRDVLVWRRKHIFLCEDDRREIDPFRGKIRCFVLYYWNPAQCNQFTKPNVINVHCTICPISKYPFDIVTYYINCATASWTYI